MPPARPRVLEDTRSETPTTNIKDRVVSGTTASKGKKANTNASNGTLNVAKAGAVVGSSTAAGTGASTGSTNAVLEPPHVDWSHLPTQALHSYRSAYRLQIPSSYTQSHAELLYSSCDLALRAPSQVLARRKAHDLKVYRRKQADQISNGRSQANGVSKTQKTMRIKEKDKKNNGKDKDAKDDTTDTPMISIEGPPSPTSHPSQQDANSNTADNVSRTSRHSPTISTVDHQPQPEEDPDAVPLSLNQQAPEDTVVGSLSPGSLATSIRTHFNAQQVNEAETIAKFTYVVRQQGSSTAPRILPLSQRLGILPLPQTTAESIASVASNAGNTALNSLAAVSAAPPGAAASSTTADKGKANAHSAHSLSAPRVLGGNHIEVEGSYGDGTGWIMGTTSCGRQVRIQDGGGGGAGAFRLRFRP
ncbi:hypothetical protein OHC33_001605 [Knufia fluminis]|uniref:Histone deacetylase complex subunit SAP30 Sin3 binding domain-containing protein n=1 Tax=Knufia fluminis TaxID=191047 RepID=A0AAN8ERJ0_9EURO|nr:hypothetical protein OHC33_001605 [Knufia fluminis]